MPCPPPGDHLNQGIEFLSLMSPILAGGFFTSRATWEAPCVYMYIYVFYVQIARVYTLNHLVSILPKNISFSFLNASAYSAHTVHSPSLCTSFATCISLHSESVLVSEFILSSMKSQSILSSREFQIHCYQLSSIRPWAVKSASTMNAYI